MATLPKSKQGQTATTVVCQFDSATEAQAAVRDLMAAGVPQSALSLGPAPSGQVGGTLLTVHTNPSLEGKIDTVLSRYNKVETAEQIRQHDARPASSSASGDQTLQVVEEELVVGKREVERGGVRVTSHIVETPVEEQITLRDETVTVERRKVDRPITAADQAFQEQSITLTETDEEAVVGKTARVREEILIGKEATQRTETVRDTVRSTEVEVEQIGSTGATSDDQDFRQHFTKSFGSVKGASYDAYAPAYQYGSRMAGNAQYKGKSFRDVEATLKADYQRANPNSAWEQAKSAVQYGWEKVTGQR